MSIQSDSKEIHAITHKNQYGFCFLVVSCQRSSEGVVFTTDTGLKYTAKEDR